MNQPPSSTTQGPERTPFWSFCLPILLLAALIRFFALGKYEMWSDECASVVNALSPRGILAAALADTNPPLYNLLLKGWMALFGTSAAGVRSLSVLCAVAQLAVMGAWIRSLGLGRRAALCAVLIGALSPLHLHYSQEARSYALQGLLATLTLWSFTAALARNDSRVWRAWTLHGLCVVLGFYAHNLFVFLLPGLWIIAALQRPSRRVWVPLLLTYLVAGLICLPWALVTLRAVNQGGLAWLGELDPNSWSLIPRSLETLAVGTSLPAFVRLVSPPAWLRAVGLLWMLAALAGATLAPTRNRPALIALAVLALSPLLALLLYSLLRTPIYMLGRYDLLALPALLALLGAGLAQVTRLPSTRAPRGMVCGLACSVPLAILTPSLISKALPFPAGMLHHPQELRGEVLREYSRPGDRIVCLGLEGVKMTYQHIRAPLPGELRFFPREMGDHLGYFHYRQAEHNLATLASDADVLLADFDPQAAGLRLFVVLDPYSFRTAQDTPIVRAHTVVAQQLLDALQRHGFVESTDAAWSARTTKLGVRLFLRNPRHDANN